MKKILLAIVLMLIPQLVLAADARPDRPHWSLELKGGAFFPNASDWSKFYGSSYMGEYGGALSYKFLRQFEAGISGSFASASGSGFLQSSGQTSGNVTFQRAPVDVFVLARGIFNEKQLLVPYLGGGYTRMFYRAEIQDQGTVQGSVNGFHGRSGVQILMDGLDPSASESLYRDFGVHHTYFIMEGKYTRAMADTVSAGSVNLGGISAFGGFMFEF